MSGFVKTSYVNVDGQLTNTRTRVHQLIVQGVNTNIGLLQLTESSVGGATSVALAIPGQAGLVPIEWDPPLIFTTGVSIDVPTSVAITIVYEPA